MSENDHMVQGEPDRSLVALAEQIAPDGIVAPHVARRLELKADELDLRARAAKLRAASRTADNVSKFGGGSLLTATVALLISGRPDWPIIGVAALTLLSFVVAIIFGTVFDLRAATFERHAERIAAVMKEMQ